MIGREWWTEKPGVLYFMELQRVGHDWTITTNAAAAAKSFQSCPTLCDPIDGSPPGSPAPGILQARTLEWVAISFSMHESEKWKWSCSVVSDPQRPHGLQPTRLLRPWDFPGKTAGVGWVPLPSPWYLTKAPQKRNRVLAMDCGPVKTDPNRWNRVPFDVHVKPDGGEPPWESEPEKHKPVRWESLRATAQGKFKLKINQARKRRECC